VVAALSSGHVEPWRPIIVRVAGLALEAEHHRAEIVADPQARHGVDDDAQASDALELVVPAIGLVSVHVLEQVVVTRTPQRAFHFVR